MKKPLGTRLRPAIRDAAKSVEALRREGKRRPRHELGETRWVKDRVAPLPGELGPR